MCIIYVYQTRGTKNMKITKTYAIVRINEIKETLKDYERLGWEETTNYKVLTGKLIAFEEILQALEIVC